MTRETDVTRIIRHTIHEHAVDEMSVSDIVHLADRIILALHEAGYTIAKLPDKDNELPELRSNAPMG